MSHPNVSLGSLSKLIPTALSSLGIGWLLRDEFTDTRAAGSVNGTPATPGPGTRTVVDTGSLLSVSDGFLITSGRTGNNDPGLWLDAVTRTPGRVCVCQVRLEAVSAGSRIVFGFDTNQSGAPVDAFSNIDVNLRGAPGGGQQNIAIIDRNYYFYLAQVLRSTGAYYFIKERENFPTWTLLWISAQDATSTLYPTVSRHNAGGGTTKFGLLHVRDELFLPALLLYETFTGDNGTSLDAHTSDTTGPDGQLLTSLTGVEQSGDWDIQSNRANPDGAGIHTWDVSQADVFIDLTINGGAAGNPGIVLRFTDTSNYWYLQADRANDILELHEVNATVDTVRASNAVVINDSTDYVLRAICYGQTIVGWIDNGDYVSYTSAALNETATKHGLYADNTACQFDDLLILARDDGYSKLNKHAGLNAYITPYTTKSQGIELASHIAYWRMNEASGSLAEDLSAEGNDGAYTGVTLGETGIGDGLTCPSFDGANDYVDIQSAGFDADFDPTEFTISIWMKVSDAADWTDGIERALIRLFSDANNIIRIVSSVGNNTLGYVYIAGGVNQTDHKTGVTTTDWVHVGLTVSASSDEMILYYNGIQVGVIVTGLGVWAGSLTISTIGAFNLTPTNVWKGWLAHCLILDKALTPWQMFQLGAVGPLT